MKITDVKGKDGGSNQWFDISITEGKYREIRILLEYTGLTVNRLIRTSYGPFHLAKLRVEEVQPAPHNMLINHFPKEVYSL
jgi:23S rRNA pseudouridine2605 synthase